MKPPVLISTLLIGSIGLIQSVSAAADEPTAPQATDPTTSVDYVKGKGVVIRSADRQFALKLKLFGQLLYTATGGDGPQANGSSRQTDDWLHAFAVRRARVYFSGNLFGEHTKYYVQLAVSPQDMKFKQGTPTQSPFFDWYFRFDHLRDLTLQAGQYRVPFNKSRVIPYAKLQFVDRTAANFEFNLDRDLGLDLRSADLFGLNLLRYYLGLFMARGRDGFQESELGLLYVARLELHPLGLFKDYQEADLQRSATPQLSIGAAYAFLDDATKSKGVLGSAPADGGTSDIHTATADIGFKLLGLSVSSEFYLRKAERNYGTTAQLDDAGDPVLDAEGNPVVIHSPPRDGWGWYGQVGWLLPVWPLECVGRYGQVHPLDDDSPVERLDELGLGLNWHVVGPSMALKADYHHRYAQATFDEATDLIRLSFQAGF